MIRQAKDQLDSKLRLLKAEISHLQEVCDHSRTESDGTSDGENFIFSCLDCDKVIIVNGLEP
jgi:hypothetical protein